MRRVLLGLLAVGVLALGAPSASAAERYEGGCEFAAARHATVTEPDELAGALYAVVAAYDPTTATALPIVGRCWIEVDGVAQAGTTLEFSGDGVAAGATTIAYTAAVEQVVHMCQSITYGSTSETWCGWPPEPQFPPQEVIDLLNEIFAFLDDVINTVCDLTDCGVGWLDEVLNLLVCPVIASLSPGVPGVVDIDSEGDIAVAGEPFWDCPPFGS